MKTIVGNWKMNVGVRESVALARGTLLALRGRKVIPDVVICPPFVALTEVHKVIAHSSIALGAQDVFWEESGAYTGEISSRMLAELGVGYVLIGHSERRAFFGETEEMIQKKIAHALASQLIPILCVGETEAERVAGIQQDRVKEQIIRVFSSIRFRSNDRVFIAYEPVWAVGMGITPAVGETIFMHEFIRSLFTDVLVNINVNNIQILYGGSVDGQNAYQFLRESQVDGLLVGGASVKLNQFKDILYAAYEVLEAQQSSIDHAL